MLTSYKNQSIDLHSKSMTGFYMRIALALDGFIVVAIAPRIHIYVIFTSNDMFGMAIWDKLPKCIFESFEIARVKLGLTITKQRAITK